MSYQALKGKKDEAQIRAVYIQANSKFRLAPIIEALNALWEAVCWIPITERFPSESGIYDISGKDAFNEERRVETYVEFDADTGVFDTFMEVEAWKENIIPYTPPKEENKL